ncbi:unnamed protein product, partial [Ectocarpus sp. 13 AM-2016]
MEGRLVPAAKPTVDNDPFFSAIEKFVRFPGVNSRADRQSQLLNYVTARRCDHIRSTRHGARLALVALVRSMLEGEDFNPDYSTQTFVNMMMTELTNLAHDSKIVNLFTAKFFAVAFDRGHSKV